MPIQAVPFGRDTSCVERLRPGKVVSGRRLIAEACVRRLRTSRGTLLDDPNYGLALVDLLGSELTPQQEAAVPSRIRNELLKDPRVDDVRVTIAKTREGTSILFTVDLEIVTALGPFDLSLAVDEVDLTVLAIPEAA